MCDNTCTPIPAKLHRCGRSSQPIRFTISPDCLVPRWQSKLEYPTQSLSSHGIRTAVAKDYHTAGLLETDLDRGRRPCTHPNAACKRSVQIMHPTIKHPTSTIGAPNQHHQHIQLPHARRAVRPSVCERTHPPSPSKYACARPHLPCTAMCCWKAEADSAASDTSPATQSTAVAGCAARMASACAEGAPGRMSCTCSYPQLSQPAGG